MFACINFMFIFNLVYLLSSCLDALLFFFLFAFFHLIHHILFYDIFSFLFLIFEFLHFFPLGSYIRIWSPSVKDPLWGSQPNTEGEKNIMR